MTDMDLDGLKNELRNYEVQRDQAQVNFQQLVGAIFVLTNMIRKFEAANMEGGANGEVDNKDSQSTS